MAPEQFRGLVDAAKKGDEGAWSEIYAELAPAVLGYLRGSRAGEPEDVCGETFLQVARDLERFDGDWAAFRGWVFTVAHHRMLDASRHSSRRPADPVAEPPEPRGAPAADAADEALARIGNERVREVLGALSTDQRAVLLLRIVGDLTLEQTAKAVGKRTGAVKQLQRRGLAAVKRELERQGVTR
jgi:RNA polymerase sigma-70 factor (ECF subfamily)